MTPIDKAEELLSKFGSHLTHENIRYAKARACAIICVDEIIAAFDQSIYTTIDENGGSLEEYWQQVKTHIQQL